MFDAWITRVYYLVIKLKFNFFAEISQKALLNIFLVNLTVSRYDHKYGHVSYVCIL